MQPIFAKVCVLTLLLSPLIARSTTPPPQFIRCSESCLNIKLDSNNSNTSRTPPIEYCAWLTSDGKCECDWEKIVTEAGGCQCTNSLHRIDSLNRCVCDSSKCERNECSKSEEMVDECCRETCRCPKDSVRATLSDGGEWCDCLECEVGGCEGNETMQLIKKGDGKPGTCCDEYRCLQPQDPPQTPPCTDGTIWSPEPCTKCHCITGVSFCSQQPACSNHTMRPCLSNDRLYLHGQEWREDECTNCTCVDGERRCVAHFCETAESSACPPVTCEKRCQFGLRVNRRGCPVCKCKMPDKEAVMKMLKINCTAEECVLPSGCNATAGGSGAKQCPKCVEPYPHILIMALVGMIVFLVTLVTVLAALLYRERKRNDCTLSIHPPSPQHKYIPMFDANLNTEKPMSAEIKNGALKL